MIMLWLKKKTRSLNKLTDFNVEYPRVLEHLPFAA